MPIQIDDSNQSNEIKVKTVYNSEVMIAYMDEHIQYEEFCSEIRKICRFAPDQVRHCHK